MREDEPVQISSVGPGLFDFDNIHHTDVHTGISRLVLVLVSPVCLFLQNSRSDTVFGS